MAVQYEDHPKLKPKKLKLSTNVRTKFTEQFKKGELSLADKAPLFSSFTPENKFVEKIGDIEYIDQLEKLIKQE